MKKAFNEYHSLRIYRRMSTLNIMNLMMCNRMMKVKPLVANSSKLYKVSSRIFTPTLTDFIINQTFCKVFTAGNTLQQANSVSSTFRKDNLSVILDYCAQGDIKEGDNEVLNDQNALLFAKSADALSKYSNEMISIKITGLVKMPLLKLLNDSVLLRDKFWLQNSQEGKLTGQKAFQGFQKIYDGLSDEQFIEYLQKIHGYKGNPKQFSIDQMGFKMNHYPYYLQNQEKNQNLIIKLFLPLDASQSRAFHNLKMRLLKICEPHANNQNGFKILVDAEQSYVQKAIEVISQQLQLKYNKQSLFIIPTIQNYLKSSVNRSKYQVQIAKRRNLVFGAKLVRGAYLVQQSKLAQQNGTQNPIVGCFQDTTKNYYQSFKIMAENFDKGEIIVASHNKDTVYDTAKIAQQTNTKVRISYAQLLGLADHLTYKAKNDGFRVYKYLPWAGTKTMIPYMIRRAEQLSQMKYPLDDQYNLLKDELKERYLW